MRTGNQMSEKRYSVHVEFPDESVTVWRGCRSYGALFPIVDVRDGVIVAEFIDRAGRHNRIAGCGFCQIVEEADNV